MDDRQGRRTRKWLVLGTAGVIAGTVTIRPSVQFARPRLLALCGRPNDNDE